jgi:outer membrane biosynthesis protein TonB
MIFSTPEQNSFEAYLAKPRGDKHIRLHISRNTLIAFVVSIVLHLLVLLLVVPKIDLDTSTPNTTIEVSLAPKTKAPEIAPLPEPPQPEFVPEPKIIAQKPSSQPKKPRPRDFSVPKVLTQESNEQALPSPPSKPQPQSPADAPTDMASYVAQQRAKRESAESDAARQNAQAAAAEQGLTEEQKRDERIKNNLKSGTNGIFSIPRLETRSATVSFKGWTDYSNVKLKFYEVEASSGEDIKLVAVRRIIAIIREHYNGDFPWESQRLGRTITKSARLEDSKELEDFLMIEFFGSNYKTVQ